MPDKELRLLALDGGGVRGLSALIILGQLMEMVNPDSPPKPCDYFDMIGGTSTGGLIAVMLGRLKMSIHECVDAYLSLSDRIFQKKKHRVTAKGNIQGRFDSEELERAIKDVITGKGLEKDALLKDASDEACKVFVCATSKHTSETICLTSYKSPRGFSDLLDSVKIWEACRATSAASSFFDPITVGRYGEEFVDGATGANNPVWEVWNEAQLMWGPEPLESRIKCLVSIGTGVPSLKPFRDDIFCIGKTLVAIATETEQTAERFRRDKSYLDNIGRYYRFNVARGLEDIGLEETIRRKEIAAATRRYVQAQEVFKQMQACAGNAGVRECFGEYQEVYSTEDVLRASEPMDRRVRINTGDPLSISASIAGLIALCGQIYYIISGFISNVEDAPRSARSAIAAIEQMKFVLLSVQKLIINRSSVSYERKALIQLDDLIITLTESVITLSDLMSHISPLAADSERTSKEWNQLRSSWQEGKVSHYVRRIELHKMWITTMLNILQSESDEKARFSQAKLQSMIEHVMEQNQDMVARLKRLENTLDATIPAASTLEDSQSTIRAPSHRGDNVLSVESVVSKEVNIDRIRRGSFEGVLQSTRVYRRTEGYDTDVSFTTSIRRLHAWSIFSGLSLADISELSAIALPLFYEDLTDGISFHDSQPRAHHLRDPDLQATQEVSTTHNSEGIVPQALSRKVSLERTPQLGMDYRRNVLTGNQQQKASFNSRVYARFAGANNTQNGILPKAPNIFWDEEKIEAAVTRQSVLSNLRPDEQALVDGPVRLGDGLTNNTYMEWIDLKAKRIFLILVDLGIPDRIFGVIDDSWDDNDLPMPLDEVHRLQLSYDKDEKLERKFFTRQFCYLLRAIQKGDGLYYDENEVVPLELAERKAIGQVAGLAQNDVDQVHLPGKTDNIFMRRRIPLGIGPGRMPQEEFLSRVETMRAVNHNHLASLWASYIHQDCGYLLLTPVTDSNLKAFLTVTPQSVKLLAKMERRFLLLNWLHCLADALSLLHDKGLSHRNIKPSNMTLGQDNHIFLGDAETFSTNAFPGEKRGFDREAYNYAAPEQAPRHPTSPPISLPVSRPTTARRSSINSFPFPPTMPISKRNILSNYNSQKSDIFSLGTVFLEILTFFMKRSSRNFASYRSAKNKTAGQGGGLPDASFHMNLGQVNGWIDILRNDASKKEDRVFRGVSPILDLVEQMVVVDLDERPNAKFVQERLGAILTGMCGLVNQGATPAGESILPKVMLHCEIRRTDESETDSKFEEQGRSRSHEVGRKPKVKPWQADRKSVV